MLWHNTPRKTWVLGPELLLQTPQLCQSPVFSDRKVNSVFEFQFKQAEQNNKTNPLYDQLCSLVTRQENVCFAEIIHSDENSVCVCVFIV